MEDRKSFRSYTVSLILILIFVVALFLRVWYLSEVLRAPDYNEFRQDLSVQDYHARAILSGDWTLPEGRSDPKIPTTPYYRPPGYVYLLVVIYWFSGGSYLAPRLFNVVIGLVSIYLMFRLSRVVFGLFPAVVTAILMATYWGFIYYEGEVNDPSVFVFLLPCMLFTLDQWRNSFRVRWIVLTGILTGCYALMRPNILLYGPIMAAWLLWIGLRAVKIKETAMAWVALAGVTALTIAPVTIRNYRVSGEFVPISTYFGENLHIGNSEYSDGVTSWTPYLQELEGSGKFSVWEYDRIVQGLGREVGREDLTHSEASTIFMYKALDWIRNNPKQALALTLKKAILFWSPWEITENKVVHYEKAFYPPLKFLPGFSYVFALALFGTLLLAWDLISDNLLCEREKKHSLEMLFLIYGLIIAYWVSFWPFFVNARARHPLAGLLFLIGSYGIWRWVYTLRKGQILKGMLLAALFGVLLWGAAQDIYPYQPDKARWHYARADSWLRRGELEKAKQEAESMLKEAYSLYMPFRLGHGFALKKEYEIAERLLIAALGSNPDEQPKPYVQDLFFHIGVIRAASGKNEEAREAFEKALTLNPKDSRAHNDLAILLQGEGNVEEAINHYRLAIEFNPKFTLAMTNLGHLLGRLGNHQEAADLFRRSMEIEPKNLDHHYNLAVQLQALGQDNEALALYDALLELTPEDVRSLNNSALILVKQGQTEKAESRLRHAVSLSPDFSLARANLGNLLIQQGDFEAGIAIYQEGLTRNPDNAELLNGLGYHYALHGELDKARQSYEKALQREPDFEKARMNLVHLHKQQGNYDDALDHLHRLLSKMPDNVNILLEMGNTYALKGLLSEAEKCYTKALSIKSDFEPARINLLQIQSLNIQRSN